MLTCPDCGTEMIAEVDKPYFCPKCQKHWWKVVHKGGASEFSGDRDAVRRVVQAIQDVLPQ